MTQPTINFEDGTFPDAEVSEIEHLTAAIRDLAAAMRDFAGERAPADPNIERVLPGTRESEEFWRDFSVRDLHDALVGPADEPVGVPVRALDNVPDGWVAVLDPPVYMSEEIASRSGIRVGRELWVRKVRRTVGSDFYGWCFLEAGELHEEITWGANTDQVRALGLGYSDFSAPEC